MNWWILYERLSSESTEFRELDDLQFAQLKAVITGKGPRPSLVQLRDGIVTKEMAAFRWCKGLLSFNQIVRDQKREPAVRGPTEQQDDVNYVGAAIVLAVLAEKFTDQAALTRYLDLHRHIRTHKPTPRRKTIHAGDLLRQLASDANAGFEQLDQEEIAARTQREKQKSLRKQK